MSTSVEAALVERRAAALDLLAALEREHAAVVAASEDSNADDEHDPEGATIAFERAQLDSSIADLRAQVDQLGAALERVAAGTYGICEVCGLPIPPERLAVRPAARTHVACAG